MTHEKAAPSARIVRCPSCGKSTRYDQTNPDRPFCSSRCKTLDTAQWADEGYRIPAKPDHSESDLGIPRSEEEDEDY